MKNYYICLVAIVLMGFSLTACGRNADETDSNYETVVYEEDLPPNGSTGDGLISDEVDSYELLTVREFGTVPVSELTTEHFLCDLDYMLYVLENNFALFDVAYWASGANIHTIIENARSAVLDITDMDILYFLMILEQHFLPLSRSTGHFSFISPGLHRQIRRMPRSAWQYTLHSHGARTRLLLPHVVQFYETLDNIVEQDTGERFSQFFLQYSEHDLYLLYRRFLYELRFHGYYDLADEIWQAVLSFDDSKISELTAYASEILSAIPNVQTRVIEEDRIAYISVDSFMTYPPGLDQQIIFNFYAQIRDFDHLIIDLRNNGGGAPAWFYDVFVSPNIDREFIVEGFSFIAYGNYSSFYANFENNRSSFPVSGVPVVIDEKIWPIEEVLELYYLPQLNIADMERLNYAFRTAVTISPNLLRRFDYEPAFQGKIWLLTGPLMQSAAQISAWVTQDIGFATLVGEVTGGYYGGARTHIALPYSGLIFTMDLFYVTDRHGRPLEAGTIPDFFNREGMNALETVLAMIAEGEY